MIITKTGDSTIAELNVNTNEKSRPKTGIHSIILIINLSQFMFFYFLHFLYKEIGTKEYC